jgi:serine/threonine-protein kinase
MMARNPSDRHVDVAAVRVELAALARHEIAVAPAAAPPVRRVDATAYAATEEIAPPQRARVHVLAVLPFRNVGDPADAYVAEGLTEDLIDTLSMQASVRVRSRATPLGETTDAVAAGKALGVDMVVEGRVRRSGDGYRLTARLIGVEDGFQLWAARCDAREAELLASLDDFARGIADALASKLQAPPRAAPTDPAAIDLYLRARVCLRDAWHTKARLEQAVDMFEAARARAPHDAHVLSGCAMARVRLEFFAQRSEEAERDTARAVEIAPHLAESWLALALLHLYRNDMTGVVQPLRKALAIAPAMARPHEILGRVLLEGGEVAEATGLLERALDLDPSTVEPRWDLTRAYALVGAWPRVNALLSHEVSGEAAILMRAITEARTHLWRKHVEPDVSTPVFETMESPSPVLQYVRAYRKIAATGRFDPEVRATIDAAEATVAPGSRLRPIVNQMRAEFLFAAAEHDDALEYVDRAVQTGLADLAWMDRCPLLDAGRSSPRWPALRSVVEERALGIVATSRNPQPSS